MADKTGWQSGFTLVELAAVLVIIGLIIGGVVVGQNLVRSSELNSILTDVDKFKTAIVLFDQKYNALPGDFKNAESYWGTDPNTCPLGTPGSTAPATATCSGDGNGQIGNWFAGTSMSETYRAWQQLADAGMIQGSYSGVYGSAGNVYDGRPGVNVPTSRIQGAGYMLGYGGYFAGNADWWADNYGHTLQFGLNLPSAGGGTYYPILTAEEADSIDNKFDDGKPATGNIVAFKSTSGVTPGCTTTAVASTAAYSVSTGGRLCSLIFKKIVQGDAQ